MFSGRKLDCRNNISSGIFTARCNNSIGLIERRKVYEHFDISFIGILDTHYFSVWPPCRCADVRRARCVFYVDPLVTPAILSIVNEGGCSEIRQCSSPAAESNDQFSTQIAI